MYEFLHRLIFAAINFRADLFSRRKTQGFRDVSTLVESLLQRDYEYELDYGVYEDVR